MPSRVKIFRNCSYVFSCWRRYFVKRRSTQIGSTTTLTIRKLYNHCCARTERTTSPKTVIVTCSYPEARQHTLSPELTTDTGLASFISPFSYFWDRNKLPVSNEPSLFALSAASPRTTTSSSRTSLACGSKASWTTRTRTARSSPTLHTLASKPPHTQTHTHTPTLFTLHSPVEGMDEGMFGWRPRRGIGGVLPLLLQPFVTPPPFSPPSSSSVFSVSLFAEGWKTVNVNQLQDRCWRCGSLLFLSL